MPQPTPERNPFMLMINPEVVFAAMEASERLAQLDRHLCRPLDRVLPVGADTASSAQAEAGGDDGGEDGTEGDAEYGGDGVELSPEA